MRYLLYSILFISINLNALSFPTTYFDPPFRNGTTANIGGTCGGLQQYLDTTFSSNIYDTTNTSTSKCTYVDTNTYILLSASSDSFNNIDVCSYAQPYVKYTASVGHNLVCNAKCRADDTSCPVGQVIDPETCQCGVPPPPVCVTFEVLNEAQDTCILDSDGDGSSDEAEKIAGSDPYDANSTPETDKPASSQSCEIYPNWSPNYIGWTSLGNYPSNTCIATTQNSNIHDQDNYYFTSCTSTVCIGSCLCEQRLCPQGQLYLSAMRGCVNEVQNNNCTPAPSSVNLIESGGYCYERTMCAEDISLVASQNEVDCILDINGNLDTNVTRQTSSDDFLSAMNTYKPSTESSQQDIIREIQASNNFLSKIADNTANTDNTSLNIGTSNLESLSSNTNNILSNIDGDLDLSNNSLNSIKDELTKSIQTPDTTDFQGMTGEDTFDEIESTLESSFSTFSYINVFGLNNYDGAIPTYTVSVRGKVYTLMSPSTLDGVDFVLIRSILLLIAALAGFLTVFRTI